MCQECNGNYSYCPCCSNDETEEVTCPVCFGFKEMVSDCCGEPLIEDTDFCSACGDHCGSEEIICERCKGEGVIYEPI